MFMLENDRLTVELYDWPGVRRYAHKAAGVEMQGSGPDGRWAVNGSVVPWEQWEIAATQHADRSTVVYDMLRRDTGLRLSVSFRLQSCEVIARLSVSDDPARSLERLDWVGQPLLACRDGRFSFARTEVRQQSWKLLPGGGRGLYDRISVLERIGDAIPDRCAVPTMHTCLFNDELCCFVHTNYPVLPLLSEASASGKYIGRADAYAISPNTYQYRVRDKVMEPLEMRIVFLTDLNGDGKADECDYQLWLNRRFPDANPIYKEAIWYKVFCAERKQGVLTSLREVLEIVRQICHVTGGLPQIVYLVGWQYDGHDTGYPSLDRINPKLAEAPDRAREELLALIREARERYNCTISFHINVDDAYPESPDWRPELLSRDPDGSPRVWLDLERKAYHVSHTKDVESGQAFARFEKFLKLVPVEQTLHLDAFRNTNASWEEDAYIGPLEEFVCGMLPIIAFFKERGIDVSTEGRNGMPIEDSGVFSAYWHYSPSLLYHGKIVGGGSVDMNATAWGKGASIDADISYRGEPVRQEGEHFATNTFDAHWHRIVDTIYLGSMLYRFYLAREMVEMREDRTQVTIRFGDGVRVQVNKAAGQLTVTWGSVVIADNDDRFIPTDRRIYLYSRHGSDRSWKLPDGWTEARDVRAYRLTRDGKEATGDWRMADGELHIRLLPRVPVILEKEE